MPLLRWLYNVIARLVETLRSLLVIALYSRSVPAVSFGQAQPGRECVVLGSGPSLKQTLAEQINAIRQRDVMCTNNFITSPAFTLTQPHYYVFMDTAFWIKSTSPRQQEIYRQYAEKMVTEVRWPMTIYLPQAAGRWNYFQDVPQRNNHITICYVNTTQVNTWRPLAYAWYRRQLAMPTMQNVLVAALYLAVQLKYQKVWLVGGDHSWHESLYVDDKNKLYIRNVGFQDDQEVTLEPFYEDPAETKPYKMYNLLRDFSLMFRGYMEVDAYARSRHTRIYNASQKSYIDAFERLALPHEPAS